jgi:hypothetical protein
MTEIVYKTEKVGTAELKYSIDADVVRLISAISETDMNNIKTALGKEDPTIEEIKQAIDDGLVAIAEKTTDERVSILVSKGYTKEDADVIIQKLIENNLI